MPQNPVGDEFDIDTWLEAISNHESGGDPSIQRLDKDGATGSYQITKKNIRDWSIELYGEEFTPDEVAASPDIQRHMAKTKFEQYRQKRGNNLEELAKDWYGRGKTLPGHPTPDEYAKRQVATYRRLLAKKRSQQPIQQRSLYDLSDEELNAMTPEQILALRDGTAAPAAAPAPIPTQAGTEGQVSPDGKFKYSNGRWIDNTGQLPSELNPAGVDQQQLVVDPNNPQQGVPSYPKEGPGSYIPQKGQPGYTPTYGEEGYAAPSMDYLKVQEPAANEHLRPKGIGKEGQTLDGFTYSEDLGWKSAQELQQIKTQRELGLARKRTIQVPHGGKLTLQQANDSLTQFVFGGDTAEAQRRQAAALKAGLLPAPLSVLTDDNGQPLADEGRFQEQVIGKSVGDPRLGQYYLPITVNEQAVALREQFNKEAGVDTEDWLRVQEEDDPALKRLKEAEYKRKVKERVGLEPFRQLAAARLANTAPWDGPQTPEEKEKWIDKKARELKADEPLANTVLNFFGAGYNKRDYAGQGPPVGNSALDQFSPELAALTRIFNPATPLIALFGGEEERRMVRDGAQGLSAFFNGLSFGALSDYDPRYDEAFNQLSPQQQKRFLERTEIAKMTARSAGTTAGIALLVGGGEVAGILGAASKGAGLVRTARAANWIEKTIQASGFNGMGIGSSIAQATVYGAIDEAVKTGAPSLDEWAKGGGWNENATAAENIGNYLGRFAKRLPDDAGQFIIGNQFGRIAEKIAADFGLRAVAKEVVGRTAEGLGEFVQEAGSQLYKGEGFDTKALMTAGMLGFVMGNGGGNADIHVVSNKGLVYKLDSKGGLTLVPKGAVDPKAELIPEGAILGKAALGVDDFYVAVWGKDGARQQQLEVQEQALGDTANVAGVTVQAGPAVAPAPEATAHLAEAHRGYTAERASGEAPPQSIFGSDAGVRAAAANANEIEQQLRRDPESYIVEQEDDAEALAQVATTIKQAYEGKKGPDSVLGLNAEAGTVEPITDPEQLKAVKAEAIKQAALAPDGSINIGRAQKVKEIVDAIGEQYTDPAGFLKALDTAVETQKANAKSIRDEFGSKSGQERRYNAEVESSAAEVSRVQGELQQLNDAQAKLNEERRVTRDAVRDAEDYALTAQDGVTEAEDQLAQAEQAAEQARVPLKAALERGGLTKSQGRKLNGAVEAADAKVEQAKKGVEKAKQIVARAGQAVQRARSADSRKLEDLQEATKAFGAKQKEFKAAQDRESRAYDTREAFIKEQKKAAAEREAASPAPSANKAAQSAPKAQNNSTAAPKAASSPKSETAPSSEPKEQTTSTEYAGPDVESAPDIASKKPAERAKFLSKPENAANLADRAISVLEKTVKDGDVNKGSSVYIDGTEATEGFAVSLNMEHVTGPGADMAGEMAKYVAREDVQKALVEKPNRVVGTWFNEEDGQVYFDVSEVVENEADAIEMGDINGQFGYFDVSKKVSDPENAYKPLPFGETKRKVADRLRNIVGPTVGLWMTEQEALDFAQPLTSMVSLAAKEKNRSIEDQFNVMVKNGLLGITGHTKIKVGGTEIPAHVAEDGTVTLAQRTLTPADFVNLYMTPVAVPEEGKSRVLIKEIADKFNGLVGNKIQPFDAKGKDKETRFQEWKATVIERFVESSLIDIKDAFNIADVSPGSLRVKGHENAGRAEALALLERGFNWYDKGLKEAIANVAKYRPELEVNEQGKPVDPFATLAFATMLGAHSPGNKPSSNGPQAVEQYVDWQAQRDEAIAAGTDPDLVPLPLVNLSAFASVEQQFEVNGKVKKVDLAVPGAAYSRAGHNPIIAINKLAQIKFGGNTKQAIQWLHDLHPRSEVLEMARQMKGGQIDLPRGAEIPGAFILNTKIGAFIANLGGNFDPVTIDLWFSKTYNRHNGTIVAAEKKDKNKIVSEEEAEEGGDSGGASETGIARNNWEKVAMQEATEALAKVLEKEWRGRGRLGKQMREAFGPPSTVKPAQVQGLLWYIEQQIWIANGQNDAESVSYEESTKEYAANWDAHKARREQGKADVEAAWRSDLYHGTSPDRKALDGKKLKKKAGERTDPSAVFGASPDLKSNAATVQFLIDSLAHYKSMPRIVVSQVSEGESVTWGTPRNAWVVMRQDAVTPHSVHDSQKAAERAAQQLKNYRGEFQQGIVRLTALELQRDFLVKEIQKDSGKSREEVEAEIKNLADVHAALLPIRTELYQEQKAPQSTELVRLDHYSTTGGLSELDPLKMGTGARSSRTERDSEVKRTYFYRAGTTPENVVAKDPKVKHRYTATLTPEQTLYDLAVDPSGIVAQAIKDNGGVANGDMFLNRIKEAGYAGYFNSKAGSQSNVVALFNPQAVTEVTPESALHMLGPTLKGEIQRIASIGGAPTTDALVAILAGKPEYLSGVANYLIKQRSKLLAGEMTVRDVAKAYIITLSSMGATEQHVAGKDVQSAVAGLDPEMQTGADVAGIPAKDFLSTKKGKTMIRPEDFMAKFFLTKDGQALLDHVEEVAAGKAELDEALFAPMTAVRAGFGNTITTTDFTFSEPKAGVYTLRNIAEFVKELNEVGKAGDPEAILGVVTKLKGIAEGKKGFIGQLLGFGGAATVDAVEINTWLLGKGSVLKGSGEAALTKRATRPDLAPLMRQLVEKGMETLAMDPRIASQLSQVEMDPATFNTIMHHWLWDRMKGTETSHAGLYKAMELAHSEDAVGHILGMVGYSGMGPATINYYVGANAATMAHEPVHVYRRFMPKADLQIAEKWVAKATGLKVHNGQWLPAHDEALARGFEQWLLEGKLPSNAPEGLLGVFERMKAAILAVYQDHDQYKQKGQVDDFVGKLDDNIRGVFERMLGLRTAVGTPSQQAALDNYKNRAGRGKANSEKTYQVAGPDDEKFARDMMLTYCRWDFRRMPIADQRALLEEIFEVQRDGVSPRTKEEVLGPVFAGRVGEFRDSKVPAMGQAALQRRMAKRLDDATQMSPQFDSDARQILEIYRFGQHAFNALYPNKSVAKRLPSFTLYLAHYHPQMLLNVVRSRAKLAGTDIFSDKWLAKEKALRDLVRESLYTPTFVNVTFNQSNQGGAELYQRNVPANPEAEAALQKVRDYFGTTDNIKEVGMLTPDGAGLALFKDGWDMHANKLVKAGVDDLDLLDFITETGAARISSDGYYLNVEAGAPLTRAQVEYLEDHAYTHRETRVDLHKIVEGEWPSFEHVAVERDEANKFLGKLRRAEREAFGHKDGYTTLYMANRTKRAEAEELLNIAVEKLGLAESIADTAFVTPNGETLRQGYSNSHAITLDENGLPKDFLEQTGSLRVRVQWNNRNEYGVEATGPLTLAQAKWVTEQSHDMMVEYRVGGSVKTGPAYRYVKLEASDSSSKKLGTLRKAERLAYGEDHTTLFSANPPAAQQANAAAIAAAAQQVAAAFNALDQASWQEIVADIRKAGMLSGIRTHLGNVISNTAFQIVEEAARYPAVAADMLFRLRYGQRSITASQLDNVRAIYHSLSLADTPNIGGSADPESLEKARKAGLRRFTDELFGVSSNTANTQTSSNDHGWNRDNKAVVAIEKITNAVFKTLQAEDAVFHSYAMRRHLLDLARVAVKNGEATSQADFLANLTEADIDQANADALIATFNNNNALSTGISNLKSSLSEHGGLGAYSKLAVELIVPFDRTPTNIIGRMFDYTPLGMILGSGGRHEREMVLSSGDYVPSSIISKIKALEGLRKERLLGAANISDRDIRVLQREATKQLGRGSVGTIILIGAALGRLGTIMGLGDDDDWDRNEATGAQKGSMLIGGRWVSLNRMQPIGSLLVLGATIQQSLQRESTGGGVVSDTAMAALKQLMQIPSLRGFTDFGKATDDENKLESFTGRMIASLIPTVIKDIADAGDSLQRDTKDQSVNVGGLFSVPVGPAMAAIPGLRETLPAKKDFLGRDLPETHWAQAFFDPFNTSPSRSSGIDKASIGKEAKDDPVFKELDRLDVNITKPKRLAGESEEDYVQRLRVTGTAAYRAVEKQIATQAYKDAAGLRAKSGKVKQKEWLEDRIEDAKREATSKLKKWAEAQGKKQSKVAEPEFPWEIEAAEKKANKMPSRPSIKSIMKDTPEKPEGFDQ